MKCPLTFPLVRYGSGSDDFAKGDCIKEKCAWWDSTNGLCAILQLSKSIYYIGAEVAQMEIKMPHEEQFRK